MIRLAVPRRTWTIGLSIACVALTLAAWGGERLDAHPAMAAPAAAADQGGGSTNVYELVSDYSNKCLSVWGIHDLGAGAVQWTCVGQSNQHWRLEPSDTGSYYLRIGHSDQCLSVWLTQDLGAGAVQWSCVGQNNQEWTLEPSGDGSYYLRIGHSGQCLSVYPTHEDGAGVVQWTCVGVTNQRWRLRPVSPGSGGEDLSTADIVRFLEQATWGPTPELIDHVREVGFEAFIDEQLSASMSSYPTLPPVPTTRDTATCPNNSVCQRDNYSMYPLQTQFFRNGLYGQDQLRQRVAFALHQIIVVSAADINRPFWMAPYLQTLEEYSTRRNDRGARDRLRREHGRGRKRRLAETSPDLNIEFQEASVTELPYEDAAFDVITSHRCLMALLDWDRQKQALDELHRVLKPGGILVLMEGTFDGLDRLNFFRRKFGLDEIEPDGRGRLLTLKFHERELLEHVAPSWELVRTQRFGMYYFLTRIVQPLLVAPEAPSYDHELNRVARDIARVFPDLEHMGHLVGFVLRRRA